MVKGVGELNTKTIIMFILVMIMTFMVSGCNNVNSKVTEEQAKSIVVEHHTKDIGEVEIISITTKYNTYIIEWENKGNCEKGTDSVNKKGDFKMIEASIC